MNLAEVFTQNELNDYLSLETDEARRLFAQEHFKRDFKSFVYLLGYRDLGEFHKKQLQEIAKFRFVENRSVRRLWFWARGFFKTSLITEAHTLWLIVNNPDIRVLIVSFSLEVAKKPLGAIRNAFLGNEDFRFFFREFCPKPNKEGKLEWGTTEAFTIVNRKTNKKEPTVMCAGIGTNITGLHFDVMKIDDLVNKDSVTNDTQIQSSKDYYSLLRPIFDNPTLPREDVIGTIYHFNDLHSDLKNNKEFEKSEIPAYDESGFRFPERLNEEGWNKLIQDPSLNPYDIQRQWLLRPINPKDAKFKESWINYYVKTPERLAEYICVDPASTTKKKSDYTVIEKWGVDSEGNHYLLEGIRDKMDSFKRIDKVIEFAKRCSKLMWIKYEVLGGRHGDLEHLKQKMFEERIPCVPKETKSTTSSKADRIEQRLCGPYNASKIFWPHTYLYKSEYDGKIHDFVQEFRLELLQFPYTEHDDILDCQSQMFEETVAVGEKPLTKSKKISVTADLEEKHFNAMKKLQNLNPLAPEGWAENRMANNRFRKILLRS